ncbi:MAG: DUF1788 domain-containing protein [Bifidobacterium breve]|nr:DUF1788 domain-containing protein [Bifidobacterium breve]
MAAPAGGRLLSGARRHVRCGCGRAERCLANQYQDAAAEQRAHVVFLTGIGHVYPYIRAHAMLDLIQKIFPASIPVVLFFPGKYEKTATTVSVMRLLTSSDFDSLIRSYGKWLSDNTTYTQLDEWYEVMFHFWMKTTTIRSSM